VPLREQSIHLRGCLDPDARERSPDIDVLRVAVDQETPLLVTVRGRDGLLPGFIVTADEGPAASYGWMRELVAHQGDAFAANVILPAAGNYTFVIADRRDFDYAREVVERYRLGERVTAVLFSPVFGVLAPRDLVSWVLETRVPARASGPVFLLSFRSAAAASAWAAVPRT
jgi:hypothetical protein